MPHPEFEQVSWHDHLDELQWRQGEHVLVAAPTGAGKTTMAATLTKKRANVVVFVGKLHDKTFAEQFRGWKILREWPKHGPKRWESHCLLWPEAGKTIPETVVNQRNVFRDGMDAIFREGNRCIVFDETLQMSDPRGIGLGQRISQLLYMGRSSRISVVCLAQRPAWIPKIIYSSVSHAYIARTRDKDDLRRLGDFAGVDTTALRANIARLPVKHDYVYVNPHGDSPEQIVNTRK